MYDEPQAQKVKMDPNNGLGGQKSDLDSNLSLSVSPFFTYLLCVPFVVSLNVRDPKFPQDAILF